MSKFFPPPTEADLKNIENTIYPAEVANFTEITELEVA